MSRRVIVVPVAQGDIGAAFDWYEQTKPGLGHELIEALSLCFDVIAAHPGQFARIHGPIRRALLRRFPYAVFFIEDQTDVSVLAVMHMARDPDLWRSRGSP
jgi:plasmid stabilization system protein ParE